MKLSYAQYRILKMLNDLDKTSTKDRQIHKLGIPEQFFDNADELCTIQIIFFLWRQKYIILYPYYNPQITDLGRKALSDYEK